MPDTLESLAERLSPTRARTSYFDPGPGQSVMSRYANAGRRLADSELAAEASSRLTQSRERRLMARDRQVQFDRDEEDYREKQDFKIQRGKFLETIAAIRPEAEDFEDQISNLYKTLPPAAMQDDAVVDMLHAKRATATDLRNERQMQARRDEDQANRIALLRERHRTDPRLAPLSPEEYDKFWTPDGEFDSVGAGQLAYQKSRQDKVNDQVDVAKQKAALKIEKAKDEELSPRGKELRDLAKEHTTGDAEAFPDQVNVIRQRLAASTKKTGKALEDLVKADPGYAAAKEYESNKFVSELESARKMGLDEYVAKGGSSDASKAKRKTVWEAAQVGKEESKALDRDTATAILKEAGGDKAKAREIARERGYQF